MMKLWAGVFLNITKLNLGNLLFTFRKKKKISLIVYIVKYFSFKGIFKF